ncbi:hypothetical protein [Variovorax sp.]|jgi:hypothetical protein|uniref:hypothetical protein n=1 Tax=Variovorax sp. TaxID=1871043 RepID=UPI0037D9D6D3
MGSFDCALSIGASSQRLYSGAEAFGGFVENLEKPIFNHVCFGSPDARWADPDDEQVRRRKAASQATPHLCANQRKHVSPLMQLCCSNDSASQVLAARIDALASHRRVVESIFVPHEASRGLDSIRRMTREQFEREKFRASLTHGGSGS